MSAVDEKNLGSTAWSKADFKQSIVHFTNALNLNPDKDLQLVLYSNRSAAYLKLKDHKSSLADAEKCIEIDNKWLKGYTRKGDALHSQGKLKDALIAYQDGLKVDSNDKTLKEKCESVQAAIRFASISTYQTRSSSTIGKLLVSGMSTLRYVLLMAVLIYLIPIGSTSRIAYISAAGAEVIICLILIYLNHGGPQFNMTYVQKIATDTTTPNLFLAALISFSRPYLLAVAPLFLHELTFITNNLFSYARANLPQLQQQMQPMIERFLPQMRGQNLEAIFAPQQLNQVNHQLNKLAATSEVMLGVFLILELILPSRNFLFTMIWWQYLQMRYVTDSTGLIKSSFSQLDAKIISWLSHRLCPQILMTGYNMLRAFCKKKVTLPNADTPRDTSASGSTGGGGFMQNAMSKCTIM